MTNKTLSYEELVKKRDSLKEQMKIAMNDDRLFCKLYIEYKNIVEKITDIDDYWNAHD